MTKYLWIDPEDEYHRRDAVRGDTILMPCNATESSEVKWTSNKTYEGFRDVYINGTLTGSRNVLKRFSVVNGTTLRIYNVLPTDSGLYDCYEPDGGRVVGYHLVAESKLATIIVHIYDPFNIAVNLIHHPRHLQCRIFQ